MPESRSFRSPRPGVSRRRSSSFAAARRCRGLKPVRSPFMTSTRNRTVSLPPSVSCRTMSASSSSGAELDCVAATGEGGRPGTSGSWSRTSRTGTGRARRAGCRPPFQSRCPTPGQSRRFRFLCKRNPSTGSNRPLIPSDLAWSDEDSTVMMGFPPNLPPRSRGKGQRSRGREKGLPAEGVADVALRADCA